MKLKNENSKKVTFILLTLILLMSCIALSPTKVQAAGWLDYVQDITLGEAISNTIEEPTINVNSISLNPSKITLNEGAQHTITATVLPDNATDKTITWQSTDSSVATVENGVVQAVSVGTASIVASSLDGEITATCAVTVTCPHAYQTSFAPASKNNNGYLTEKCTKCGDIRQDCTIYAIGGPVVCKCIMTYNGKFQSPLVGVVDIRGNHLKYDTDYTLSYTENMKNVGTHTLTINFKGNYTGAINLTFTIHPNSPVIKKVKSKKKGFTVTWKKQAAQVTAYELAYSTSSSFGKYRTNIVTISKNKATKTFSKLKKGRRYYVRMRIYKDVKENGRTRRRYSKWSKVKSVIVKK